MACIELFDVYSARKEADPFDDTRNALKRRAPGNFCASKPRRGNKKMARRFNAGDRPQRLRIQVP